MQTLPTIAKNREHFWKNADYRLQGEDDDSNGRKAWFARVVRLYKPRSVLELGCNEASNLRRIRALAPSIELAGLEINPDAARKAQETLPGARITCGSIYDADKYFKEKEFDLVFSMGVLIHIPPEGVGTIKDHCIRLAKQLILHCEEHSESPKAMRFDKRVPHRWSHDYFSLYDGYSPTVYSNIVGSADGAHQLAIIELGDNFFGLTSVIKDIRLWYLCRFLPFKDRWGSRIRVRWNVRRFPGFFLP